MGVRERAAGRAGLFLTLMPNEVLRAAGLGGYLPDFSPCVSAAQWFEEQLR